MRKRDAIPCALERLWEQAWPMDGRIRVNSCKRGDQRLLDKVFESKPIKRGGVKFHFDSSKNHSLKLQTHVFTNHQQLHNCTHFFKPLYFQKVKQHEQSTSNEERMRWLNKVIPQDNEETGGDDRYVTSKENNENSQRSQHDNHRDGK